MRAAVRPAIRSAAAPSTGWYCRAGTSAASPSYGRAAAAAPVALAQLPAPVAVSPAGTPSWPRSPGCGSAGGGGSHGGVGGGRPGRGGQDRAGRAGRPHRPAPRSFGGGVVFVDLHGYDDAPVQPGQALDALLRALGVAAEHIPRGPRSGPGCTGRRWPRSPVRCWWSRIMPRRRRRCGRCCRGRGRTGCWSRPGILWPGWGPGCWTSRCWVRRRRSRCWTRALRAARPGDDRISGDRRGGGRLAGVCGGLPLALQITAALLTADPALTAGELADELAR